MEQVLLEEVVPEVVEEVAEAEWEAPDLVQDQLVSVYVRHVVLR